MAQETELSIKISADVERAVKGINSLRGEIRRLGSDRGGRQLSENLDAAGGSLQKMLGTSITLRGVLAGLGAGLAFRAIIRNTVEAEAAFTQLSNVVRSTGAAAGYTAPQLAAMAGELQNVTTFGDQSIQRMQAVLLGFRNVQGPIFREASELALDLSTRLGRDLTGSAVLLGKALQEPTRAVGALRNAGVEFSDEQEKVIKRLTATGDIAGAQRVILDELKTSYGGAARAARDTFGGALEGLKNAFSDLLEGKSGLNEAKSSVEALTKTLRDPNTVAAFDSYISLAARAAGKTAEFLAAMQFLVSGPANELVKLDDAIIKTDTLLERLRDQLSKPRALRGGVLVGQDFFASDEAINRRIQQQIEKRRALVAEYDALLAKSAAGVAPGETPTGTGFKPPPVSDEFTKANEELQRRIALLGEESELQKVLFEIESGRYQDLVDSEQKALLATAARLDELNEQRLRIKEVADESRQENEEHERTAEALRNQINPYREVEQWINKVRAALENGDTTQDEYNEALFIADERFKALGKNAEKTTDEMTEFTLQAARNMQSAFADGFFDILNGRFDTLGENFSNLLKRMAAELAASQMLNLLFGANYTRTGQLGGLVGGVIAGVQHEGGVVGGSSPSRRVPALAFAGAQRLHNGGIAGLRSDEVPTILQRGEVVLTPEQLGTRSQPVTVQIENRGTPINAQSADVRFDAEGMVVRIITEDAQRGGPIVNTLRRSLTR